jgi:uncharacterized coiled-coil DUF342 family protein
MSATIDSCEDLGGYVAYYIEGQDTCYGWGGTADDALSEAKAIRETIRELKRNVEDAFDQIRELTEKCQEIQKTADEFSIQAEKHEKDANSFAGTVVDVCKERDKLRAECLTLTAAAERAEVYFRPSQPPYEQPESIHRVLTDALKPK